jgi:hypothetical protein
MRRSTLLAALLIACRKEPAAAGGGPADAAAQGPATEGGPGEAVALVQGRCRPAGEAVLLDDGGGADDLEIGDGVAHAGGYAVSLVHRTAEGRVAAVALLDAEASRPRIVDLGPTPGDAPPPRLASCHGALVAGAFRSPLSGARAGSSLDGSRELALHVVGAPGPEPAVLSIAQHRDDSLAFDLACLGESGLAVWDEAVPAKDGVAARGVIRAASFDVGRQVAASRDVSPSDSDAETPRVVRSGGGFVVVWLAHRAEGSGAIGAASDGARVIETTGEARAYGWLEMIAVDPAGKPTGPSRRLTPASGHVSGYDVLERDGRDGPVKDTVLVVARDDEESADGAGGVLLRVRMRERGDRIDPPSVLRTDGLGRGAPAFVDAPAPWLSWVSAREQLRLLPLDADGEIAAAPSAEDTLEESRPLLAFGGEPRMLVAALPERDKAAQLRVFTCPR